MLSPHILLVPSRNLLHGISSRGDSTAKKVTTISHDSSPRPTKKSTSPAPLHTSFLCGASFAPSEVTSYSEHTSCSEEFLATLWVFGKYLLYCWLFLQIDLHQVMRLSLLGFRSFCQHGKFGLPSQRWRQVRFVLPVIAEVQLFFSKA